MSLFHRVGRWLAARLYWRLKKVYLVNFKPYQLKYSDRVGWWVDGICGYMVSGYCNTQKEAICRTFAQHFGVNRGKFPLFR